MNNYGKGKKLLITIGDYGTGKTTFAKWFAKNNDGLFIDFELLYFGKQQNGVDTFDTFSKRLAFTLQNSPKHLFVMDGYRAVEDDRWQSPDPTFKYLQDNIKCDIQLCLTFAAPHIVRQRQAIKATYVSDPLPRSESMIKSVTFSFYALATAYDSNSLFVDTTNGFQFISKEDWSQRWQDLIFLSELDKKNHDKYYQDIELSSGLVVHGYSQGIETWKRLSKLINFKGKDVIDIGCLHGYFCFKAEKAGARNVFGIEVDNVALEVARQIAWLNKSRVRFSLGDIAKINAGQVYDIAFVLNMLHHVKDVDKALQTIFAIGREVIFEIPTEQEQTIYNCAAQAGFKPIGVANSHRIDRKIIVYVCPQIKPVSLYVPEPYFYDYLNERRKKLVRDFIARGAKIRFLYPLVWLVRKYRQQKTLR